MLYSKSTGGFYNRKVHGESIPPDSVEITSDEYSALLLSQSMGYQIEPDEEGRPISVKQSPMQAAELLGRAKDGLRVIRQNILDAVTGMGFRALVSGNTALAQEAAQVSLQILDITDDSALNAAQTYEEIRSAGMAAYRRIADSVSPDLRSAFKELEK